MAISVGSVSVDVVPNAERFWSTFKDQTKKEAASAADDISKTIGDRIAGKVSKALPEGMAKGAAAAKAQGSKAGEDFGGAFAAVAKTKITAALRALPKAKVDLDPSSAEAKVAKLRAELVALGDKTIGVNINEKELLAQATRIKDQLQTIFRDEPLTKALQHDVNAGLRQLEAFETAARKVDADRRAASDAAIAKLQKMRGDAENQEAIKLKAEFENLEDEARVLAAFKAEQERLNEIKLKVAVEGEDEARAKLQKMYSGIADDRAKALGEGFGRALARAEEMKAAGDKAAEDFGGAFSRTVRSRIAAALQSLPKADIDADSTDAEVKVAALRAELEELSGKTIGLDIDEALLLSELARIKTALNEVARDRTANIRVRTAATEASVPLAAVQAQVDKLDGKKIGIKVNADTGGALGAIAAVDSAGSIMGNRFERLLFAVVALGPAIVPVAAVAAGALVAIGAGALVGAAGVGVLALAFGGIASTVAAIRNARVSAADEAVRAAKKDLTATSAAAAAQEQVRSAVAGVASARASAAEGAVRASDAVATAERSLGQAQIDASRVQQTLNQARVDAKRAMEDLNLQVRAGALDQRQATLDVAKAKAELAKTLADPKASALERQQAQLTFEKAQQHVTELSAKQKRLTQDKRASDKAGVNGSQQVTSAVREIGQAQEKVRVAERQVADARRAQATQARQSAASIASAQRQVASAQRSVATATVDTGTIGGASMRALRKEMEAQTPAGVAFATFLDGLAPRFKALKAAAQGGVLPGVQAAIVTLLPFLPRFTGFVGRLADVIGDLFRRAAVAFTSPFWQKFFGYIDRTAGPALDAMARVVGNLAVGFAGLLLAFAPVSEQMGRGLLGMTERFAAFAATASTNRGFQEFLAYVKAEGPVVAQTILELLKAALHLAIALAPIGHVVLLGIQAFSRAIQSIPTPVLTVLLGVVVALVVGLKAWAIWQRITTGLSKASSAVHIATGRALATYTLAAQGAGTQTSKLGGALGAVRGSASVAKLGLSGLVGFLGGPWGVAIAIATAGILHFFSQQREQKQRVDDLTGSLGQLSDAYKESARTGSDEPLKAMGKQNKAFQDLIINATNYGLTVSEVAKAAEGDVPSIEKVTKAYDDQIAALKRLPNTAPAIPGPQIWLEGLVGDTTTADAVARNERLAALEAERKAILAAADAAAKAKAATDQLTGTDAAGATVQGRYKQALDQSKTAQDSLTQARINAKAKLLDLQSQEVNGALGVRQAALNVTDATLNLARVKRETAGKNTAEAILARAQAQLGVDQAIQHQKDAKARQAQVVAENAAAKKKGIEGDAGVDAARKVHAEKEAARKTAAAAQDAENAKKRRREADEAAQIRKAHDDADVARKKSGGGVAAALKKAQEAREASQLKANTGQARSWENMSTQIFNAINRTVNGALTPFVSLINKVLGWLRLPPIDLKPPSKSVPKNVIPLAGGKALGGVLPGYSPGVDNMLVPLSGGEAIIRPEGTRALGPAWVDGINYASRVGGVGGARTFLSGRGYAGGGIATFPKMKAWLARHFPDASASTYQGSNSYHPDYAADIFAPGVTTGKGVARSVFAGIKGTFLPFIKELIWDFAGANAVWNGKNHKFSGGRSGLGSHDDHIHWAMLNDGFGGGAAAFAGADTSGTASGEFSDPLGIVSKVNAILATVDKKPKGGLATMLSAAPLALGEKIIERALALMNPVSGVVDFVKEKAKGVFDFVTSPFRDSSNSSGAASSALASLAYPVAQSMGASNKVLLALFEAGIVESGMRNINFGDRDSVGWLQQRPSQGWPDPMNITTSTRSFITKAIANQNKFGTAGQLAQSVQKSGYPDKYDKAESGARAILRGLGVAGFDSGGYLPPGLSMAWNGTGRPEPVMTNGQLQAMQSGRDGHMTLRVVVDDGVVPGLVRVEVDEAFGSLADARVYGTADA